MNDNPSIDKSSAKNLKNEHEKTRISVEEYREMVTSSKPHILIDVRTEPEMEICALNNSVNVPIEDFQAQSSLDKIVNLIKQDNQIDSYLQTVL